MGLFDKIKTFISGKKDTNKYLEGFNNTNKKIEATFKNIHGLTKEKHDTFMEDLMITLLEADVGYQTSNKICDHFYQKIQNLAFVSQRDLKYNLYETIYDIYGKQDPTEINFNKQGPSVILMVGVNGSGKTTSCAKLAHKLLSENKTVLLVAGDTFRAGAVTQLDIWAKRLGIECVSGFENEDPSSVLIKGLRRGKEKNIDVIICDTAGRLQTKLNLMNELNKMNRVLNKEIPNAPHETFLVIDTNTGQNGLSQAKLFNEVTKLTGIILTKMDGTSKGGIILSIKNEVGVAVKYLGLGENIEDLSDFYLELYLYSILGDLKGDK